MSFSLRGITAEDGSDAPLRTTIEQVNSYALDILKASILKAASDLNGTPFDPTFKQSLRSFALGDRRWFGKQRNTRSCVGEPDDLEAELVPVAILQDYTSMATIVGGTNAADHQSRYRIVGIGERYDEDAIRPLQTNRERFGVAYIAALRAPTIVTRSDTSTCRDVASDVIRAYLVLGGDRRDQRANSMRAYGRAPEAAQHVTGLRRYCGGLQIRDLGDGTFSGARRAKPSGRA